MESFEKYINALTMLIEAKILYFSTRQIVYEARRFETWKIMG